MCTVSAAAAISLASIPQLLHQPCLPLWHVPAVYIIRWCMHHPLMSITSHCSSFIRLAQFIIKVRTTANNCVT